MSGSIKPRTLYYYDTHGNLLVANPFASLDSATHYVLSIAILIHGLITRIFDYLQTMHREPMNLMRRSCVVKYCLI